MAALLRRFARATPIPFAAQSNPSHSNLRLPFAAIAAISGGVSFLYYYSSPSLVHSQQTEQEESRNTALNPDKWIEFKLQDTARVSHNTQLFRFSFDPTQKLGLDIASCILTSIRITAGLHWDKMLKENQNLLYARCLFLNLQVYPEGKMSQHFASLKPGDVVEVKGPIEKLRYTPNMKKQIGMVSIFTPVAMDNTGIAGGSGITPMLQVIEAILKNPDDKTQVSLLYANVSPDDILLKQKLDILATSHPNLKIFYTVDNPTKNWRGGAGYISKDMVVKGLPAPSDDTLILVCGPPGMMKQISGEKAKDWTQGEVSGILKEAGYTEQMVYKF
ncbi:hypothetical protein V8G54_017264 [Vigna mungo]|uniref:cytochrome-b5 reductase n=1 Tax=Vigna mungo TaxID=3915 RepID=A0AAQ3NLT6_VIGMU